MFDRLDDTIIAVSSPPGTGVRGILRLSGPDAFALASSRFETRDGHPLSPAGGNRRVHGRLRITDRGTVPGEAWCFRGPRSYTRQDVVELHTLGSPALLSILLEMLTAAGARPADPGEFTARAYFAGSLDLSEVEGVAAAIHARNDSQLRAAEALLQGRLSAMSRDLRDQLADLLALIEAEIDFVEEPISFVSLSRVREVVGSVGSAIDALLEHAASVERFAVLPEVVLIGRPNAGKSTLFNRLTRIDRAIASAVAGTTRDVLDAPLALPAGEVLLLDTAGLLAADDALDAMPETIRLAAQTASRRALQRADLIIAVVDVTDDPEGALRALLPLLEDRPARLVLNKIDVWNRADEKIFFEPAHALASPIAVSAATGEGVEALRGAIQEMIFTGARDRGGESMALSVRQSQALREARDALKRAEEICMNSEEISGFSERLAFDVRAAMHRLSLLIGAVTTEDLLARIFAGFCIGK